MSTLGSVLVLCVLGGVVPLTVEATVTTTLRQARRRSHRGP